MTYVSDNSRKWEYKNSLYQKHLERYLDRMHFHLMQNGDARVLDAGCGEGYVYRAMRKRGFQGQWSGFDFSEGAIEMAKKQSPEAEWRAASIYEIPFPDKSFDLIFSSQVFEHLAEPERALRECTRVAQKRLLLSVPWEPVFRSLTWISTTLKIGGDPGHVNFWSRQSFRHFLAGAGKLVAHERTTIYQIALVER